MFKRSAKLLPQFYHWAIVVRGVCYEVASSDDGRHKLHMQNFKEWRDRRNLPHNMLIKLKLGLTMAQDTEIRDKGKSRLGTRDSPYGRD